ncbi:unnamed protein product [Mycena citricolor]|uniref:Homeobox domain-containing protein n=1 Tax=Mycena citricolor TaxID=2018698 RepID=A0AAD2HPZ8_9AGAR|nr:unnamed protein product [Mycena citricolor]
MTAVATSRETSILRQIFDSANSIQLPKYPAAAEVPDVIYELSLPPSMAEKLQDMGLNSSQAANLDSRFQSKSNILRRSSEQALRNACRDIAAVPRETSMLPLSQLLAALVRAHTDSYMKAIARLRQGTISVALHALSRRGTTPQTPSSVESGKRLETSSPQDRKVSPKFNHEFTPYLQQHFAHNAFPSLAERAEMARKSGMEARQIEVWFQNHRRRARQEGQTLRRVQPSSRGLSPTELDEKMDPAFVIPEERRLEIDDEAEEVGTSSDEETDSSVSSPAASHAGMEHNPLEMVVSTPGLAPRRTYETMDEIASSGRTWSFAPPTWAVRAPAPERSAPPSIATLTAAFARLTVWDVGRSAGARFCLPTAYTPPRAPLPAFVRAANKFAPHPVQSCVARTTECCVAAAGPRATGTRTGTTKSKKSKKVSGPPRRTPTRSSRSASPAWSERSESGYSSSASRTPSLSVSRRSSSSDLSSMPGTPPSGPLPLPFSFRFGGTEKA